MYDYNNGEPERLLTKDEVLDNVTLYWLTNTATSSARLYWENGTGVSSAAAQKTAEISLPVAITVFPEEVYRAPETWARRAYRNLIYFNEVDKGGHFAAWEQPELFAAELRAAFRSLGALIPRFDSRKEVYMKTTRIMAIAALIAATGLALHVAQAQQVGARRIDLQRHDLSVPGREVVQTIVELAPGTTAPRHTHPGEEIIYVLEGTWEYTVEGKPPVTLKAGEVLFIPAGTIHSARNVGTGNAAELATYIVEKGKPLLTVVE